MSTSTFPLNDTLSLIARIGSGTFTVEARDDVTEASVTLVARDRDSSILEHAAVEMRGSTLMVVLPRQGGVFDLALFGGRRDRDAVDASVVVPTGTPIKISTVSADISVHGRCGTADLATGAASIAVDDVDGDIRLRFGSGSARVHRVRGSVQVRSGSGTAAFGDVAGALNAVCGSGNLTVDTAHGSVRTRTGSGAASLGAVHADVDVASGSGALTIGVPAGTAVRLEITTGSGRVQSDLPIDGAPSPQSRAITVRARTGSGDVRFVSAA